MVMKPWIAPGIVPVDGRNSVSARAFAYAAPSEHSGSNPAVITTAGGRPANPACSGEAVGWLRSAGSGTY